jgi:hypothetical protein
MLCSTPLRYQVDIIKPNLSELRVLMTECCVHRDMNIAKKSLILKTLKKGPLHPSQPNYLVDVRMLASGLLHVMMTPPTKYHHSHESHSSSNSSTRGGSGRSVVGKHVIVTLGDQGLLWVSSSGEVMGWDGKARSVAKDVVELDDNTFSR